MALIRVVDPGAQKYKKQEFDMRRLLLSLIPLAVPSAMMVYLHLQNYRYERREQLAAKAQEQRRLQFRHM